MKKPETIDGAWLANREANARHREAVAARTASHGVGKLIDSFAVWRTESAVKRTGEHLDMVEEVQRHLGELAQSGQTAVETEPVSTSLVQTCTDDREAIGFGQIGDDEYFGH